MGTHSSERWVLAFDASCGRCRQIAGVVTETGGGRLEVLSLTHTDVVRWREQAFGSEPPWAPTLLRVPGDGTARAWTGPGMALPLLRRLGIRSTVRLSRALGDLRAAQRTPSTSGTAGSPGSTAIGRKRFLRIGAGVAAGGLLLAGRDIAMASGGSQERRQTYEQARAWVRANRDRLPTAYDAFAERPMPYRKAIYAELSPRVRSELWTEHLDRCRDARTDLTAGQREVLRTARTMAADQATFERGLDVDRERRMRELRESAVSAFGKDRARVVLATLGPPEQVSPRDDECTCVSDDDYCGEDALLRERVVV